MQVIAEITEFILTYPYFDVVIIFLKTRKLLYVNKPTIKLLDLVCELKG
jgi:hypothetical protein